MRARVTDRVPGALVWGSVPLLGAGLIAVNDFWLRRRWPGWVSGKLSDVGICLLLPALLLAGAQWAAWAMRWPVRRRPRTTAALACLVAGSYFAALEIAPAAAACHGRAMAALFGLSVHPTPDLTDLLALAVLPIVYLYLRRAP
jgi:hypothetical protein